MASHVARTVFLYVECKFCKLHSHLKSLPPHHRYVKMVFPKKKSTKKTQPNNQTNKKNQQRNAQQTKATKHVLKIENLVSLISKEIPWCEQLDCIANQNFFSILTIYISFSKNAEFVSYIYNYLYISAFFIYTYIFVYIDYICRECMYLYLCNLLRQKELKQVAGQDCAVPFGLP